LFDDHSDLDHQLELLRQRSLTSGTDLVPKGHLEETENGPVAVVSLSDLSRSQLTPQDVVPTSQRESNNSESSGGTVQSDEQTPEASPTAVQRRVSRTVSSQLTLYDLLTTSRLVSLDCHIQADHLGIHLMNGRPEHLRGDELQVGACVREVDHDSPFNKLEQGDYIVEVNGKSVLNLSAERVMSLLEGLDSLDLLLVVARAGGSSHYDTALIENLRSRNAEMERTLQGKKQEAQNATRLMQESLIAINDLKLEKENIYKKVEQLKLTIKSLENDKQSLKLQQASLREEVADAHSRAEQAYSALRDMSQKMEQLQQHQIKRINEAEEQRHVDEAALQEQVSRIKALEAELHSLRSATPNSDPHLQQKCRDLQVQVVQLEGHCLQLDEELKVAKTSRALLLKQLKKQEQRVEEVEQEQDKKDRFLQQWQMGTQVQSSDSELSQSLAEAQQDVQEKEDLIRGLNAALVELQRARTSEVMRLEADLVRLRKHIASREANADGLDSRGSEELLSAIRKQEKVIDRLSSQLKEAQYQQRAADERANQLSAALKNKMRERDRQASLGDHEKMERREAELARAELQSQLTGLLAIVRERAPEILDTLTSSDQV
jgi:chromosome segregation ATPase